MAPSAPAGAEVDGWGGRRSGPSDSLAWPALYAAPIGGASHLHGNLDQRRGRAPPGRSPPPRRSARRHVEPARILRRACSAIGARRAPSPASVAIALQAEPPRVDSGSAADDHAVDPVAHRVLHARARRARPPAARRPAPRPAPGPASRSARRRRRGRRRPRRPTPPAAASGRAARRGPPRSGAAARVAAASAAGPPPTSTSRSRGSRLAATANASSSTATFFSAARRPELATITASGGQPCAARRSRGVQRPQRSDVHPGRDDPHQRPPARSAAACRISSARALPGATMAAQPAQKSPRYAFNVPSATSGQRAQVVAVVAEAGVMREDQPGARCAEPCDAPSGPTRTATGRGRSPARSRARARRRVAGERPRHAVARRRRRRRLVGRQPRVCSATDPARPAPGGSDAVGRPRRDQQDLVAGGPSPRASVSVETVTPETYGRYDSPKTATRSAFTGRAAARAAEAGVVGDTGFEPVTSRM